MNSRIICIGNRLIDRDMAGLAVFDRLQAMDMPPGVEVIEGGLAGLDLLPLLEGVERVVFVDTVHGFTDSDQVVLLDREQIIGCLEGVHYGHEAGLPYLLTVLPKVCEGRMPQDIRLVGLEDRCTPEGIVRAAALSLSLATRDTGES
ncbi:MAG: hydrogenase maturation protease [Desulfohalobiaceae bacterium]|nr:hydrogenase maturation protease [Desulfohalobiaceae bacterium]